MWEMTRHGKTKRTTVRDFDEHFGKPLLDEFGSTSLTQITSRDISLVALRQTKARFDSVNAKISWVVFVANLWTEFSALNR